MKPIRLHTWIVIALLAAAPALGAGLVADGAAGGAAPEIYATGDGVRIASGVGKSALSVIGPGGIAWSGNFDSNPAFGAAQLGRNLPDGLYRWELRSVGTPRVRGVDSELIEGAGLLGNGIFRVVAGEVVVPDPSAIENPDKDIIHPDDVIINGGSSSLCVGFDCVNGESFGDNTIRMKENNTRIQFVDTSVGTFPTTDWRIVANDSASGGLNKLSIEDETAGRVPFTVEGGATTNSIYVDSTGRVGFRTSTPVLDLHVNTSNTPALRLEQNNSGGFTAQTWDVAGNEANFFVRDVTGGSRLPFRIRPGAATSSLTIDSDGEVGVGTFAPSQQLEVAGGDMKVGRTTGGNTSFFLENTGGAAASSWILRANGTTGGFTFTEAGGNTAFRINTGAITNALTLTSTGVDVVGTLRVNGTPMTVPDYVFAPGYDLLSIEEQGVRMEQGGHLPSVPKEQLGEDGRPIIDLVAYQMGMLEELEKAHLYIQQLHQELRQLRAELTQPPAATP